MPKVKIRADPYGDVQSVRRLLAGDAARAARTLDTVAAVLLTVVSVAAGIGLVAGAVVAALASSSDHRIVGGIIAGACLFGWAFSILPYLAARAVARYIMFRAED